MVLNQGKEQQSNRFIALYTYVVHVSSITKLLDKILLMERAIHSFGMNLELILNLLVELQGSKQLEWTYTLYPMKEIGNRNPNAHKRSW